MLRLDLREQAERTVATTPAVARSRRRSGGVAVAAWWASLALALLPVVVATVRALGRGWLPVGDNAYFALRARDVLTEHHPLLGTWTSASLTAGTNFNNPGPLLFDVFALPAKLVGGGGGVAVGAAALNVLAIVGIAVAARRLGGPMVGVVAMVATAALTWSMGSELLFDPWQPHSLLLTSLLLIVLVWSLACGDVVVLPWLVGVASLVVQTHLSYAVLVAALGAWGAIGLVAALRRRRRDDPNASRSVERTTSRSVLAAAVVLVVLWTQPLVEQVTAAGQGNLTRLVAGAGGGSDRIGAELGARIVASVVAAPPWFLRPSFEEALLPSEGSTERVAGIRLPELPSASSAAWLLALTAAVLAGCWFVARRRGDATAAAGLVTAAVAVAAGLATAAALPVGVIGIAPHQFRWLWPVAAFAFLAVATFLVDTLTAQRDEVGRRPAVTAAVSVAGSALVLALAVANLPTYNARAGPAGDAWAIPVVHRLNEGMAALEGEGPLLLDLTGIRFAEPYSGPVMAELQRRGIPFVVGDEGMVRQVGPSRRAEPGVRRLLIREGDAARRTPPGQRRAVFVEGLDETEQAELAALRAAVLGHLVGLGRVPLNERGEAALAAGALPLSERPEVLTSDPEGLLASRELSGMVERDLLDLDPGWQDRFARYAELQRASDVETVALFVAPPTDVDAASSDAASSDAASPDDGSGG